MSFQIHISSLPAVCPLKFASDNDLEDVQSYMILKYSVAIILFLQGHGYMLKAVCQNLVITELLLC